MRIKLRKFMKNISDNKETSDLFDDSLAYGELGELIISSKGTNPKELLTIELEKRGLEWEIIDVEIEQEKEIHQKFEVLSSVRDNNWDHSTSSIIPDRRVTVPNKQISEYLKLYSQPQTFDFYDKNNKKASKIVKYSGENHKESHHLTYLRMDLMDLYLSKNNYQFIWAIWGGKEFHPNEHGEYNEFRKKYQDRNSFQSIICYNDLQKH